MAPPVTAARGSALQTVASASPLPTIAEKPLSPPVQRQVDVFVTNTHATSRLSAPPVRVFATTSNQLLNDLVQALRAFQLPYVVDAAQADPKAAAAKIADNEVLVDLGIPGSGLQVVRQADGMVDLCLKRVAYVNKQDVHYDERDRDLWRLQIPSPPLVEHTAGIEAWLQFRAPNALASAINVTVNGACDVGEGALRTARGFGAGVRQTAAGAISMSAGLLSLPLASLETGCTALTEKITAWRQRATGMGALFAWATWIVTMLVMLPLRLATQAAATLVIKPCSFIAQALSAAIADESAHRCVIALVPQPIADPSHPNAVFGFNRGNVNNPEVSDPNTWVDHFASAAPSSYSMTPRLISEFTELRRTNPTSYDALRADLARCKVRCFYRFPSLAVLREVLANRTDDPNDRRPVALILATPSDWNGAFSTLRSTIDSLRKTHRLQYVEPAEGGEVANAIQRHGERRAISTLVMAGHGEPAGIVLGDSSIGTAQDWFSLTHLDRLKDHARYLAPNANVLLEACSTGFEDNLNENMAHGIHRIWPHVNVHAPKSPDRLAGVHADPQRGEFSAKALFGGALTTYRADRKALTPR